LAQTREETLGISAKQMVDLTRHPLGIGPSLILSVGVALAYFVAARLSLALLELVDGVAVFWPAAGLASGTAAPMIPRVLTDSLLRAECPQCLFDATSLGVINQ